MPAVLGDPEFLIVELPEKVKTGGPGGGGPRNLEPGGRGWGGDDDDSAPKKSPDGPSAGMVGIIATMVSITVLFATIVITYVARSKSRANWGAVPFPPYLWVSTALILASSVTLQAARRAQARLRASAYARWILITFFLGLGFIVSQALALQQLVDRGIYLRKNPHSSMFYIVTGAHGLHVLGGMLALFYLIYRNALPVKDALADLRRQDNVAGVTSVYWHFLDVIWVCLFLMLLLWQ